MSDNSQTVTVSVLQCPFHERSRSLEIAVGDAGVRVAGGKCCGRWEVQTTWKVDRKRLKRDVAYILTERKVTREGKNAD